MVIAGEKKYSAQQKARFAVLLALAVWAVVIIAGASLAYFLGGVLGGGDAPEASAAAASAQ